MKKTKKKARKKMDDVKEKATSEGVAPEGDEVEQDVEGGAEESFESEMRRRVDRLEQHVFSKVLG